MDIFSQNIVSNFQHSFPFEWKNPNGYLIVLIWQGVGILIILRFLACLAPLAFAFFIIAFTGTKDWKNYLQTLEKMAENKQSKADIFKQITEFFRSHSGVKQLSREVVCTQRVINFSCIFFTKDFVNVYEVSILADVMCCTVTLCAVMMMIQSEILV